jgi:hypothetical protein
MNSKNDKLKRKKKQIFLFLISLIVLPVQILRANSNELRENNIVKFVWKAKDYDYPGSVYFHNKNAIIEYNVKKGNGSLKIARRNQSIGNATIILAANPTKSAQIAALEFRHYVKKLTGVILTISTDSAYPVRGPLIFIRQYSSFNGS